jgi:hypothetical protein
MNILVVLLLSTAGLALAVVVLVAFLGMIALKRCEHEDVPAVLEALGALVGAFGRAAVAVGAWLPNPLRMVSPGAGNADGAREGASYGTAPANRAVEH